MSLAMPIPHKGVLAALWTPTDREGQLDLAALKSNVAFLKQHEVDGLMVLGSTGEFVRLTLAARRQVLEAVRDAWAGWPALVNVSDMQAAQAIELGRWARELGCEAISLLPPWFFPLPQDDLVEWFVRVGEGVGLPLFLYNFPERTGNRIALDTIARVAERVPVSGVKQSGGEFEYHRDLVALGRRKRFVVFTGGEPRLAEAMALGVTGCVSGLANAVPELIRELHRAAESGDTEKTAAATARVTELGRLVDSLDFPSNVAAAIEARGLGAGQSKIPLSPTTRARYDRLVADLRERYREWGLT